ncbi:MAG: N-acetylmuramoyl-L-alanine amidase [Eubacteriales bacterium]
MSKKRSRVCLGTTRRHKNRMLRNLCITAVLLVIVVIVSAVFVSWMLDGKILPTDTHPTESTAPDTDDTDPAGMPETGSDTDAGNPAGTDTEAADSASGQDGEAAAAHAVPVSGTPYKVLDYTEQWVVMVDAGHGFDDIGTTSALLGETNEATVNLDLALRVRAILEQAGVTVLMTHDTNAVSGRVSVSDGGEMPKNNLVLLTPEDRAALANGQDIDLYVSIHCDSIPDKPEISGMRTYYCAAEEMTDTRNTGAEAIASRIACSFYDVMGAQSVVPLVKKLNEEQAYYVIRAVSVPSVLCEVGFVTNEKDAADMLDAAWREKAAQGIAQGILSYIADA